MRLQRLRFEFRMELAADEMWMVRQLDHLDVSSVGGRAGNSQSRRGESALVFAIELVTMAVALADLSLAVNSVRQRSRFDLAGPGTQPHGSAELLHATQLT